MEDSINQNIVDVMHLALYVKRYCHGNCIFNRNALEFCSGERYIFDM